MTLPDGFKLTLDAPSEYKPKLCPFYLVEKIYYHNGFPSRYPEKEPRPLEGERPKCAAYDYVSSQGFVCLRLRR